MMRINNLPEFFTYAQSILIILAIQFVFFNK
jgi:hypothetical protein